MMDVNFNEASRFKPLYVFSCNEPWTGHLLAYCKLNDVPIKEVEGFWNGEAERSFVVAADNLDDMDKSRFAPFWGDQECVLVLMPEQSALGSGARVAFMFDVPSGNSKPLGVWRKVTKAVAGRAEAYTKDGNNYYLVQPFLHRAGKTS
jgi:hypothetical protein